MVGNHYDARHCGMLQPGMVGDCMSTNEDKMSDIVSIFYPENRAGGFSGCDGTVQFYQRVHALLRPEHIVLDFGAGRGAAYYQDLSFYRKSLRNLRGEGMRVVGVDVDPVVFTNPCIAEGLCVAHAAGIVKRRATHFTPGASHRLI